MPSHRIYKPYKNDANQPTGHASKIDYRANNKKTEGVLFWTITKQTAVEDEKGNAAFGWEDPRKTVTMKLGLPDIGELLAVLEAQKDQAGPNNGKGLFHQNKNGNSSLKFKFEAGTEKSPPRYGIQIGGKVEGSDLVTLSHSLTLGEGVILREFLKGFVQFHFNVPTSQTTQEQH